MKQLKTMEFSELAYLYFKYSVLCSSDFDSRVMYEAAYLYFCEVADEIDRRVAKPFDDYTNKHYMTFCQYHSMSAG